MKNQFDREEIFPGKTLYVGIDIAKDKHWARAIDGATNKLTKPLGFTNRRKGFEKLLAEIARWARQAGAEMIVIGMEPTSVYWKPLWGYLMQEGHILKLVSSLHVKRMKDVVDNSPEKSDPKDALIIAGLVKDGKYLTHRQAEGAYEAVRILMATYDDNEKGIRVHGNHMEAYLMEYFPELTDVIKDICSRTVLRLLRAYPLPEDMMKAGEKTLARLLWDASRGQVTGDDARRLLEAAATTIGKPCGSQVIREAVHTRLLEIIDNLEACCARKEKLTKQIEKVCEGIPSYEILLSIPGVGVMTAAAIIAQIGDLREYANARQVIKKAGLNLFALSSGKRTGAKHISHRGSRLLRKILYMAAFQHTKEGTAFHDKYLGMLSRLKGSSKKAIVGLMRHILKVAFALVRDNRMFTRTVENSRGAGSDNSSLWRAQAA